MRRARLPPLTSRSPPKIPNSSTREFIWLIVVCTTCTAVVYIIGTLLLARKRRKALQLAPPPFDVVIDRTAPASVAVHVAPAPAKPPTKPALTPDASLDTRARRLGRRCVAYLMHCWRRHRVVASASSARLQGLCRALLTSAHSLLLAARSAVTPIYRTRDHAERDVFISAT